MIIEQVTKKVFIFFSPKEIILDTNFFFLQFQLCQMLKFLYMLNYIYYLFQLFSVKSTFCNNFIASFLLIKLM